MNGRTGVILHWLEDFERWVVAIDSDEGETDTEIHKRPPLVPVGGQFATALDALPPGASTTIADGEGPPHNHQRPPERGCHRRRRRERTQPVAQSVLHVDDHPPMREWVACVGLEGERVLGGRDYIDVTRGRNRSTGWLTSCDSSVEARAPGEEGMGNRPAQQSRDTSCTSCR